MPQLNTRQYCYGKPTMFYPWSGLIGRPSHFPSRVKWSPLARKDIFIQFDGFNSMDPHIQYCFTVLTQDNGNVIVKGRVASTSAVSDYLPVYHGEYSSSSNRAILMRYTGDPRELSLQGQNDVYSRSSVPDITNQNIYH